MPSNDGYELREQVAELRSDIRHIQSDVTDIKGELRATNQRIDSLNESLRNRIDSVCQSLSSAKVWALIFFGSAYSSLLLVIAKGFKWL